MANTQPVHLDLWNVQHHQAKVPREVSDSLRTMAETQASMATVDTYGALQDSRPCEGYCYGNDCINCSRYYEPGSLG